ncbi:iron-containing redox enzyme family protein [Solemya velum gill symbiont]|uniref:Iron-containing redox enzyme family protein n=2 Tax=Solemya velum gill symbiont TaxID=2340 RepID=A0A0B0H219_SOVGS|nr:iron-containing redox enzyme family protein [Solemya velum gill symbiont]KHF24263.1 hypothetical protein JV46_24440 [Solemya velum gill symbiont]OOY53750.1 hypothetical protein BOV97_00565 [Solemya velum gill symbiont]OOY57549.1 hypothetical protein BOV99_00620 [Solemya velum gill symbiont]OOY58573.1 hypothetical protein BOW00_00620 [Solemya velum gill symbiont]OOY61209.1 hypothetical protein BOW02_02105 [Solemya velum gill symbiont]
MNKDQITSAIDDFQQDVDQLVEQALLTDNPDEMRDVIRRCALVLESNFIPQISAAMITVKSKTAKQLLEHNLVEEIGGGHQDLLADFLRSADAFPSEKTYEETSAIVRKIRHYFSNAIENNDAMRSLTFITFAENMAGNIRLMHELSKRLGSEDLQYTEVHAEVDIDHGEEMIEAFVEEMKLHEETDIDQIINEVANLLHERNEVSFGVKRERLH